MCIYLLAIVFIGLILRIHNLGKFGLWLDEVIPLLSAIYSKLSTYFISVSLKNPRGIFFISLLKGWMNIASNDYFLRFFSVIWGILSIIMIYHLGKLIFSKRVGILSAILLSISPLHIYYSQELTCYSLSVFLGLSSSYCFLKFLKSPYRILSIFYILSTLGFIYTHPINLIFILTQNIFFYLFYYKDIYLRKKWICLQLIIFLMSLPWLRIVILQFLRFSQSNLFFWIPKPNLSTLLQTLMVFSLGYYASWKLQLVALIIFLYLSVRAISCWYKKNEIFYPIFWLVVPMGLMWIISQFYHFYLHRVFLFTLPAFCLLTATGMVKAKRYLKVGIIGIYLILVIYSLKNYYENKLPYGYHRRYIAVWPKKDYRKAAIYVAENFRDEDIIIHICRSSILSFQYYHRDKFPEFGIKLKDIYKKDWMIIGEKFHEKYPSPTARLSRYLEIKERDDLINYRRIWLIHSSWDFGGKIYLPSHDGIGKTIIDWFDKNFSREDMQMFEGINIYLFSFDREVH